MAVQAPKKKKKSQVAGPRGQAHVKATYNNTIVSICDQNGNVVDRASAG